MVSFFLERSSSTIHIFNILGGSIWNNWDLDEGHFHTHKIWGSQRDSEFSQNYWQNPNETSSLTVSEEKLNMTTIFEEEEGNVKAVSRR